MNTAADNTKKVLILCDWYEPGYKAGGPIQSCRNIVETLHAHFQFYILTSDRDLGDTQPYAGITLNRWVSKGNEVQAFYSSPGFLNAANVRNIVAQLQPDVVYFNSMFSKNFTLLPFRVLRKMKYEGAVILAPRGMLHAGAMKQKTLKKKIFLFLLRMAGLSKRIFFHATDAQERLDIYRYFPGARTVLAENIPNSDNSPWTPAVKKSGQLHCVFISRVHPKKNLHFFLERLKELPANADLSFDIYGIIDDEQYAEQCRRIIASLPSNIKVQFRGPLPNHQVFATLKQYHLFVLPTLGENFGHAVYESLSAGVPVLISDQTPWQNLAPQKAGWDVPLRDGRQYVSVITRLMAMDQQEYNSWSEGAHSFARKYIDSFDYVSKYVDLFQ
jgi:glycosyltransferase involved in cell wall biosynthesis